jgi:hypothetical protein
MRKRFMTIRSFIPALGLLALTAAASAGFLTYKFDSGTCDNGAAWWSVSTYIEGKLIEVDGVGCDGKPYHRYPKRVVVSADPLDGATPLFTGTASNGAAWYAQPRYDELGRVVWQGGRDEEGAYWITEIGYDDETTPGGAATPGEMR